MKLTSNIDGVHFSVSHNAWFAKTPGKKVIYRGSDQKEAERLRLEYDAQDMRQPQAKPRKNSQLFRCMMNADWPITICSFEGCDFR